MSDDLLPIDDTPVADRSTLGKYATCPRQAVLSKDIKSASLIAASGNEVHDAFRQTIDSYVASNGALTLPELAEETRINLMSARPDVQPDAIAAAIRAVWEFAKILSEIHVSAVMRYDGGRGEKSGQLTMDIAAGCRVTGAVDLLLATPSKQVVDLWDWKTGHYRWTEAAVYSSFQFQMYAALVMDRYEDVQCVRCRIFNTRMNQPTYAVEFTRERLLQYRSRISNAAGLWFQYRAKDPLMVPAWPARDKCDSCDVITRCTAADEDLREVAVDPAASLKALWLMDQKAEALRKQLAEFVRTTGTDIRTEDGICFGFGKPKADRKPTAALYVAGKQTEE